MLTSPSRSQEEEHLSPLATIFTAGTSSASIDASYRFCNLLLETTGFRGLYHYGALDEIKNAAADKKSGWRRESAQNLLGALFETFPPRQPVSEVIFLREHGGILLSCALDALADKGAVVRDAAQYGLDALFAHLRPEARLIGLLPALAWYLSNSTGKWQGTVGALKLIRKVVDWAMVPPERDESNMSSSKEAMATRLSWLVPVVEAKLHNSRWEVEKQGTQTMERLATLLSNDDVRPHITLLVDTMRNPSGEALQKAILVLSQTTFVAVVTAPVLALLTPLLERSMNNPRTAQEALRNTVIVIRNLTKLVHDPTEARVFLSELETGVKSVTARASLPAVRETATETLRVMDGLFQRDKNGAEVVTQKTTAENVAEIIHTKIKENDGGVVADYHGICRLSIPYICEMVADNVNHRLFDRIIASVAPYLKPFMQIPGVESTIANAVQKYYIEQDRRNLGKLDGVGEKELELANANFSLGYGGMLLLSQTNLTLLKGHRYGLVGPNGAGKSTLMKSIAEFKLEGMPPPTVLRTVYVEPDQGDNVAMSVLEYLTKDPDITREGAEYAPKALSEFGFAPGPGGQNQKVSSLSGGNMMKLSLAKAMLKKPDLLLLDEPTNHMDAANISWLLEYLKTHPEMTVLVVSHDASFLDAVITDIYHFEPTKKLAHFKGNLAAFARLRPEIASYYQMSASDIHFNFPPPGILTGVKSKTKAIVQMTNVSYIYPNAPPNQRHALVDISAQLSLSSRVAIVGPNGAGKSTLIKALTGEIVPTVGKVEQHPNLRIGYIKQHALEHLKMHLDKTPNQYIQWRYTYGDDREVHYKQTRLLSEADQTQLARFVDIGDGNGARQIEALVGRQKHLKSTKYEVKWKNFLPTYNTMVTRETLFKLGFQKLVQAFDDYESSRQGLEYRDLTPSVISKHLEEMKLDPETANHTRISSLSSGQRVKVVFSAALWPKPHILVLDEPTNYLDRDWLVALAGAIRDFKGAVILISHKDDFVSPLTMEYWSVNSGRLTHRGPNRKPSSNHNHLEEGSSGGVFEASSPVVPSERANNADTTVNDVKLKGSTRKKKLTRRQLKERDARRRLRYIDWLSSPKGTPRPPDTDSD